MLTASRLANFAETSDQDVQEINKDIVIFDMFKENIDKIIEEKGDQIEINKLLELQVAFLKFSLHCYPENISYVNSILESSAALCQQQPTGDFDNSTQKNIVKLLTQPLDTMQLTILGMKDYPNLMGYLPYDKRKTVAVKICEAVISSKYKLDSKKIVTQLLSFLKPLLTEDDDTGTEIEPYEFEFEQQLIAKIIHLVENEDPNVAVKILGQFTRQFMDGGIER